VGGETYRVPGVFATPLGIGYRLALEPTDTDAAVDETNLDVALGYRGKIGERIDSFVRLVRVEWLPDASPNRLWRDLPRITPVFLFEDWQMELMLFDAAFAAMGAPMSAPAEDAPFEMKLLHAWHLLLRGDVAAADAKIAALPPPARVATERMLTRRALMGLGAVIRAAQRK
jgi:hypothetical protein